MNDVCDQSKQNQETSHTIVHNEKCQDGWENGSHEFCDVDQMTDWQELQGWLVIVLSWYHWCNVWSQEMTVMSIDVSPQ